MQIIAQSGRNKALCLPPRSTAIRSSAVHGATSRCYRAHGDGAVDGAATQCDDRSGPLVLYSAAHEDRLKPNGPPSRCGRGVRLDHASYIFHADRNGCYDMYKDDGFLAALGMTAAAGAVIARRPPKEADVAIRLLVHTSMRLEIGLSSPTQTRAPSPIPRHSFRERPPASRPGGRRRRRCRPRRRG